MFYQPEIPNSIHVLPAEESRHAVRVLRLREGDAIEVTDGKGALYQCAITNADPSSCAFRITATDRQPKPAFHIHIAIAPTKNTDRIEWFVEKAVELGISEISFLICRNSERRNINHDRIEKTAVSAMKQSQQRWLPVINEPVDYKDILAKDHISKFIAHVDFQNPVHLKNLAKAGEKYLVLIGPEGDFSPDELAAASASGFQKVSLGPARLRTETAGIAACHILNLINS